MRRRSSPLRIAVALGATALLSACLANNGPRAEILRAGEVPNAPPGADPEACYARTTTPAIIETVTEQVLVQPPQIAADGSVTYPAVYRTETRQEIVRERKELWFETLCEEEMTPEFIASLQRALEVRQYFTGAITGRMDIRTRRAIRAYQGEQGVESDILSLAAARKLGLKEVERTE
ncbi:peptidoglycan-binding domain-containing protein [Celeribacter sp.]|uniref:peptidoglycan-binding domain-containing protein n=1 Tax=Celeribacter sp. TaxID=1890673 RepID=UPI003A9045AB